MSVFYFQQPFGVAGDLEAIPFAAQTDGSVSYNQGYTENYSEPRDTNPAALTISREQFNQLMFAITGNLQQYQQHGIPEYITASDNGGTAYAYDKYAMVRYNNGTEIANYISKVASNAALPTVTANWAQIRVDNAYLSGNQTFTGIQTISTAGTPLVINSTNSTGLKIAMQDNGTPRGGLGATSAWSTAFYLPDLATIAGGIDNGGNFIPGAAATYDIGSTSAQWRNVIANRFTVLGSTAPTNGLYLPAANTVGISANATLAASFTGTGINSTVIGATTPAAATFTTATATTFNGVLHGNADTATKWANPVALAGNNVDGSAAVPFANKFVAQGTADTGLSGAFFLGSLATGLLKVTTTTGALSRAVPGTDYNVPISLTTTGSGAASYNTSTGALNIPTPSSGGGPVSSVTTQFTANGTWTPNAKMLWAYIYMVGGGGGGAGSSGGNAAVGGNTSVGTLLIANGGGGGLTSGNGTGGTVGSGSLTPDFFVPGQNGKASGGGGSSGWGWGPAAAGAATGQPGAGGSGTVSGGGGGCYIEKIVFPVQVGSSQTITVGVGGASNSGDVGAAGQVNIVEMLSP